MPFRMLNSVFGINQVFARLDEPMFPNADPNLVPVRSTFL